MTSPIRDPTDIRADAARYYDLGGPDYDDVPFYRRLIPRPDAEVLELGCGTGRVLVPLAESCGRIVGLDASDAMLAICRLKIRQAKLAPDKTELHQADITRFDLGRAFDLVIAPFRVMQNLDRDEQVDGLFDSIRAHLKPTGSAVLNVFKPHWDADALRRNFPKRGELLCWEKVVGHHRVLCYEKHPPVDPRALVIRPVIIYREYDGERLVDEAFLKIAMRCYYPEEFERVVEDHGFTILNKWGGYEGEPYGRGKELVIQFRG